MVRLKLRNIFAIIGLFLGLFIFNFGMKYKLPLTSNPVTSLEAVIFKYLIIVFSLLLILVGMVFVFLRKKVDLFFRRHKDFSKNVLLLFVTVVICLLFLEFVLSFVVPPVGEDRSDHLLHHKNTPLSESRSKTDEWDISSKINSIGLRDHEIGEKGDKTRILMLGDSFTLGFGVSLEDTFTKQLETMLNDDSGVDVGGGNLGDTYEVINTGVISYSSILEYQYLKHHGLKLEPDIVILNFDMSDVMDNYKYNKSALYEGGEIVGFDVEKAKQDRRLVNVFLKSNIIRFLKPRLESILTMFVEKNIVSDDGKYDVEKDKYIIVRDNVDVDLEPHWDLTLDYVKKLKQICDEHDIVFIVHVYPYGIQVDGEEWGLGRTKWGFELGSIYSTDPLSRVEEFCKENNIIVMNSLETFRNAETKPLFFPFDGHFNENGHLVVAEFLYEELVDEGLI